MDTRSHSESVETMNNSSSLDILPDDVLRIILNYVPGDVRIQYEIVSKRWNRILKQSWILVKNVSLQFAPESLKNPKLVDKIEAIFKRCGSFVETVKFRGLFDDRDDFDVKVTESILANWASEKPIVNCLEFCACPLSLAALQTLKSFSNLQYLQLSFRRSENDADIRQFDLVLGELSNTLPHLKKLDISEARLSFSCLAQLGSAIETLDLDHCEHIDFEPTGALIEIDQYLLNRPFPNLTELYLCDTAVSPISLSLLEIMAPNLKLLDVSDACYLQDYTALARLPHLECLFLHMGFKAVDDTSPECLQELAGHNSLCRQSLSSINLDYNNFLEAEHLSLLGRFPSLYEVSLSGNEGVNEQVLASISKSCQNLKVLTVRNCPLFDDECIWKLAHYAVNLCYLDISHCVLVTANGVQTLINAFDKNKHRSTMGLKLEVYALETSVFFTLEDLRLDSNSTTTVYVKPLDARWPSHRYNQLGINPEDPDGLLPPLNALEDGVQNMDQQPPPNADAAGQNEMQGEQLVNDGNVEHVEMQDQQLLNDGNVEHIEIQEQQPPDDGNMGFDEIQHQLPNDDIDQNEA